MKPIEIRDIFSKENVEKEVYFRGWVYRRRIIGDKIFLVVRDANGIVQVVIKDPKLVEKIQPIQIEGSLAVKGIVHEDKRAPGGYEVEAKEIEVFDYGKPFPLRGREEPDTIQKYRHLWIRSRWFSAVQKIKHSLLKNLRDWYVKDGWFEVFPPILVGNACEETTTLFEVKYFDQKAYLSQSAQLYLEALIFSLGKVFSLTPSFRAEKSRTRRHLHEYWHFEIEAAWYTMEDLMKAVEESLKYAIGKTIEERKDEFEIIKEKTGRNVEELKTMTEKPWKVMTYKQAIDILKSKRVNVEYGSDLGADEERVLTLQFDTPIFVIEYPRKLKAFYMFDKDENVVKNFDLLAPEGYGEIVGGSEREWRLDVLEKKIKEWNLDKLKVKIGDEEISAYEWYLDLRRFGSVPHSGMGLGTERLLMWVCKLEHIRDTLPFPRLREGWLYP
jgi:asparaginyl-tRNA synthetase